MADTFVKNPKLIVGTQSQVEAEMGANDIGFATDIEFYTKAEVNELFNGKADVSRVEVLEGYDYVVESQEPTAENGYTWYRKYKSGWVEQGGIWTGSVSIVAFAAGSIYVTMPIEMADNKYFWRAKNNTFSCLDLFPDSTNAPCTTTTLGIRYKEFLNTTRTITSVSWQVWGMAA